MPSRLLILKCSARKLGENNIIPALERYDGPLWRVLRSFLREQPLLAADIDVYVLSAAFGLIPASHDIPWYDQTMSSERAAELQHSVLCGLERLMERDYHELCLGLSDRYLAAMRGWETLIPPDVIVTLTDGPMGTKLGQLRAWLDGRVWRPVSNLPDRLEASKSPRGEAVIAGVTLRITRDEALQRARQALKENGQDSARYRDWYVLIDGHRIAPKWLVSTLTGCPTSAFDASAARRALLAIGIDIERVTSADDS